ncbi:hypothetical protein FB45DRAFT_944479 [Roridomyces roridus]|uniref:TLC domain-containing protein n=1 Tax=Roridomyces roridus TaxID=1738132 RepID=A0AAD7B414_9AGAR|nr:hypothetical protein FB45DRAFT_944479 [Roridomyces roridus]
MTQSRIFFHLFLAVTLFTGSIILLTIYFPSLTLTISSISTQVGHGTALGSICFLGYRFGMLHRLKMLSTNLDSDDSKSTSSTMRLVTGVNIVNVINHFRMNDIVSLRKTLSENAASFGMFLFYGVRTLLVVYLIYLLVVWVMRSSSGLEGRRGEISRAGETMEAQKV